MAVEEKSDTNVPEQAPEVVAEKPKKKDLPIGVVLPLLLIVIAIIGFIGYQSLFAEPPLNPEARAKRDFIEGLAKKSGGDTSKLSKDEIAKANSMTHGFGAVTIKDVAEAKGYKK